MKKIKELINGLLKDDSSVEFAEQIGAILNECERSEQEHNDLIKAHADLRSKYVKSIKENSFKGEPDKDKEEDKQARTLEQIVNDVISEGD